MVLAPLYLTITVCPLLTKIPDETLIKGHHEKLSASQSLLLEVSLWYQLD